MPLCLSVIFHVLEERKVPKFKLALSVAVLFQTHMLSSVMLVMIFIPIFIFGFYKSENKLKFVKEVLLEMVLFIFLTLNIWAVYVEIMSNNNLIAPFINRTMSLNTINRNSFYWVVNPGSLVIILIFTIVFFIKKWKANTSENKIIFSITVFFLLLSTSIVPWDFFIEKNISFAELIQFPFRFFTPATILSLYLFLKITNFKKLATIFIILGVLQVVILMFSTLSTWDKTENFILSGSKTVLLEKNTKKVKEAFFSNNKRDALELVMKSTPDYLPLYSDDPSLDEYKMYRDKVISPSDNYSKSIHNSELIIKENSKGTNFDDKYMEFPVIVYKETNLTTMGVPLTRNQYSLSAIGTPIIDSKYINNNQLEIDFNDQYFVVFIYLTLFFWLVVLIQLFKKSS